MNLRRFSFEVAEVGREVGCIDLGVLGDIGVKVREQPVRVEFDAPPAAKTAASIEFVPVDQSFCTFGKISAKGTSVTTILAPSISRNPCALLEGASNHVAGTRENVDGHAVEFAGEGGPIPRQRETQQPLRIQARLILTKAMVFLPFGSSTLKHGKLGRRLFSSFVEITAARARRRAAILGI